MKLADFLLITLLTSLSLFLLTRYINKPFWGHHDWNSNIWTLTAKNNLNYGVFCTKLGQTTSFRPTNNCNQLRYYMNHPPLVSWLLTISYSLFGFSEYAGRLPFILCSIASAILIFLIGQKLYNRYVGFFTSLFFMATPMFNYFGKSINHEPLVLFSILLAVYSYISWIKNSKQKSYHCYLLSALITGLSGWHGYFIYPFLLVLTFFYNKRSTKKCFVPLIILLGTFFFHQAHTFLISGEFNIELISQFLTRTNLGKQSNVQGQIIQFSYPKFFIQELRWLTIYFTRFLLLGSVIFILLTLKESPEKRLKFSTAIVLTLLGFGATIPFLFSQQAFIHDYLNIYLLPFFSLATAIFLEKLKKVFNKRLIIYLSLILTVGIFFERKTFLDVLQKGQAGKIYVELAQIINQKSEDNQKFLIEANNFYNFAYPFLWNYAYGKFIDSKTDNLASFLRQRQEIEKAYDFIITVETNPVESQLIKLFDEKYKKERIEIFTFYQLDS